jgi:hypothetical protein
MEAKQNQIAAPIIFAVCVAGIDIDVYFLTINPFAG